MNNHTPHLFKSGDSGLTQDGRKYRIVAHDLKDKMPVIVLIEYKKGMEAIYRATKYGVLACANEGYLIPPSPAPNCFLSARKTQAPMSRAILSDDHKGMKVCYQGLIAQSRKAMKRDHPLLAETLRQLKQHLTELGQRWYAGDQTVVDEFLQLYCIESEKREVIKRVIEGDHK